MNCFQITSLFILILLTIWKQFKKDVPEDLGSVEGELTSQETDGWYTLANTASARVYLNNGIPRSSDS